MVLFPRAASAWLMAMAIGVLPDPPAVRLPMQTIRAWERNGRVRCSRARTERPYSAPSGASNVATAFAAALSLVQNSGARMGDERFRNRECGRKRTSQTIGRRFGAGSELGSGTGIGDQFLHQFRQFFRGIHAAVSLGCQQHME